MKQTNKTKGNGDFLEVELTQGHFMIIDKDDADLLDLCFWSANVDSGKVYAIGSINNQTVRFHRLVMDADKGQIVDHIDGDGLNNKRTNLRICTIRQNSCNTKLSSRNKTGFKGVWANKNGTYRATIGVFGKAIYIGTYESAKEAAYAYNDAAIHYHGSYASLNPI